MLIHMAAKIQGQRSLACNKCGSSRTRVLMFEECLSVYRMEDGICTNCMWKHKTIDKAQGLQGVILDESRGVGGPA